ncbi:MAG: hypothetical protein QM528_06065 [Phycisphaerales bacterium]|nr:hypothetical protein [Phycisphaerales bacterium]
MNNRIEEDIQVRWFKFIEKWQKHFDKKPDIESILFLIGIQETNIFKKKYSKEEKQDLMHVAVCFLLQGTYFQLMGFDEDGWPHYQQIKVLPPYSLKDQESFLMDYILLYFDKYGWN